MSDQINQDPEFDVPTQEEEDRQLQEAIDISLLRLDSFKNRYQNRHSCTTCACNATASTSVKRPSPEPVSEPKSKKPSLDNDNHRYSLSGFSKLPLPQLRRSVSDPYTPPKPNLSENARVLEDSPLSKGSASCSALPPKAPILRRSVSDPNSSPAKSLSRSSSSNEMGLELAKEESPDVKRLRRMKERLKDMIQWWDEVMREQEDFCTTEAIKDDGEQDCEEAVRVEKVGECLDLHFKCPCGKGYQILLSGQNCYYKLM